MTTKKQSKPSPEKPKEHEKQTTTAVSAAPLVVLLGDAALVNDFAPLCTSRGYAVLTPSTAAGLRGATGGLSVALELTNLDRVKKKENLVALDKILPATAPIITSSVTVSVLEQSGWIGMKHRLVGLAAMPGIIANALVELAPSAHTLGSTVDVARNFFGSLGKEVVVVEDRVGLVLPRILCQIVNEALFAIQSDVATPGDIDIAMKLGTHYPLGPVEWGEKIGFDQVQAVLNALYSDLGEERYRSAPLLKELAVTGKFWGTRDAESSPQPEV